VDLRFTEYFKDLLPSQLLDTFGKELYEQLSKAAGDRSKKRKETLFGLKGPSDRLRSALQRAARSAFSVGLAIGNDKSASVYRSVRPSEVVAEHQLLPTGLSVK
jgi:hypothetical protein